MCGMPRGHYPIMASSYINGSILAVAGFFENALLVKESKHSVKGFVFLFGKNSNKITSYPLLVAEIV